MKVLSFGEVLFDISEDSCTLGGAPLNVLGHISRLGGHGAIVTAVGRDSLGSKALSAMEELGIDARYASVVAAETGKAFVKLSDGIPSYSFNDGCAWDRIALSDDQKRTISKEHFDAFVFGTLAQRSPLSRTTLEWLLDNVVADEVFLDLNLRLGFHTEKIILSSIRRSTILKMNDDELRFMSSLMGIAEGKAIDHLLTEYPRLRFIILTCGKDGSHLISRNGGFHAPAGNAKAVDTVGAGDSLSAGFLHFLHSGAAPEEALSKASLLADYVVQKHGAIPEYSQELVRDLGL